MTELDVRHEVTVDRMRKLAVFLRQQAQRLRAEAPHDFNYGRGADRGMAQGYELAAGWIDQEMSAIEEVCRK